MFGENVAAEVGCSALPRTGHLSVSDPDVPHVGAIRGVTHERPRVRLCGANAPAPAVEHRRLPPLRGGGVPGTAAGVEISLRNGLALAHRLGRSAVNRGRAAASRSRSGSSEKRGDDKRRENNQTFQHDYSPFLTSCFVASYRSSGILLRKSRKRAKGIRGRPFR